MMIQITAVALVIAFISLSFFKWDRNTNINIVFADMLLMMFAGLVAKTFAPLSILIFGYITFTSFKRKCYE